MNQIPRYKIILSKEARAFIAEQPPKVADKIAYNLLRAPYTQDSELFKKLEKSEIWEFRTLYGGKAYRILAFWDKTNGALVIATHGFIKKTQKTPQKEIAKAEEIRKRYFKTK
jgi:phage-related protein